NRDRFAGDTGILHLETAASIPMMHKTSRIYGFTLIEILVVVLTLGILVLLGAVQYSKTVEMNRAEQAIVLVKQIAAANHMYSLDSSGNYVSGQLTNNACNAAACPATLTGASPCDLIACHYMPQRDWGDNAQGDFATYDAYAVNPVNGSQPCKLGANSN